MALPTLTCAQCGTEVTIPRQYASVRKFCNLCQIARETATRLPKARNCDRCGDRFWPVRTARTWTKCGKCTSRYTMEQRLASNPCNICGERIPAALGLDETCLGCVQSEEAYRDGYVKKVNEIVANRAKKLVNNSQIA